MSGIYKFEMINKNKSEIKWNLFGSKKIIGILWYNPDFDSFWKQKSPKAFICKVLRDFFNVKKLRNVN